MIDKIFLMKSISLFLSIAMLFGNAPGAFALRPGADRAAKEAVESALVFPEDPAEGPTTLNDGGERMLNPILVLSNIISLGEGAQTGIYNIEHAVLDGAVGGILNHSEARLRLETAIGNLLGNIGNLVNAGATQEQIEENFNRTLGILGLPEKELDPETKKGLHLWLEYYLHNYSSQQSNLIFGLMLDNIKEAAMRGIVNIIINVQLKKVIAYSKKYPISQTVLCVGETFAQYEKGRTGEILASDLEQILMGITAEDARRINLRIAYEPRGVIGTRLAVDPEKEIQPAHKFIKDRTEADIGIRLEVDYGGSLSGENAQAIFSLPDVNGGSLGDAAKTPEKISPVIDAAISEGERRGKVPNIVLNFRAEDKTTGLSRLTDFATLFETKDLTGVRIAISTPQVATVKKAMKRFEEMAFSFAQVTDALSLYPAVIAKTDRINEFTREALGPQIKAAKGLLLEKLERHFQEKTREGDVYFLLRKGTRYVALAKENSQDQTLMTRPIADLTDPRLREQYYADLLEYVSSASAQSGKYIELIEEKGDRLRQYLSSIEKDSIGAVRLGPKYRYGIGMEESFQIEIKPASFEANARPIMLTVKGSNRPMAREWSFIARPKVNIILNGPGTVGSKNMEDAVKNGFSIFGVVANRPESINTRDVVAKGYPVIESAELEKVLAGIAEGEEFVVIDATPQGEKNKAIYDKYSNIKLVIMHGGEKADAADISFSSYTTDYNTLPGKKYVRVVSCNTNSLAYLLGAIAKDIPNLVVDGTIMRRTVDPGILNGAVNPDSIQLLLNHHANEDLFTALDKAIAANIESINIDASQGSTTHFHLGTLTLRRDEAGQRLPLSIEEVRKILQKQDRAALVEFDEPFNTATLYEMFYNKIQVGFPYIVAVATAPSANPDEVKLVYAVPQESIVALPTIDALNAALGQAGKEASVRLTNEVARVAEKKEAVQKLAPVKIAETAPAQTEKPKPPFDYLTMDDVNLDGKTVGVRIDGNSPVNYGVIDLHARTVAAAISIKEASDRGARVVVESHQGRPGDDDYLESLEQHAEMLSKLIGKPVKYVHDLFGDEAVKAIEAMKNGDIIMLKNTRSWEGETAKVPISEHAWSEMIKKLQPLFDYYILDAFSFAHRAQATIVGFAGIPNIAGRLMENEIINNSRILIPEQPAIAILGGAKIDEYLGFMRNSLESGTYDQIFTDGLLGNVSLMALGYKLGSPTEEFMRGQFVKYESENGNGLDALVKDIGRMLQDYPGKIIVPSDVAFLNSEGKRTEVTIKEEHKTHPISGEFVVDDIGTHTAERYAQEAAREDIKTLFVKGPMGNYKVNIDGSMTVFQDGIAKSGAMKISGGGDTDTLAEKMGVEFDYSSLSGGALVKYMGEGKSALPVLGVLENSAKYYRGLSQALGVSIDDLAGFNKAGEKIFDAFDGEGFGKYIDTLVYGKVSRKPRALIVPQEFLEQPGAINVIRALSPLKERLQIGLYGANAEKLKALLGIENVITAETLERLQNALAGNSFDIVMLGANEDVATVVVSEAIGELFGAPAAQLSPAPELSGKIAEAIEIYKQFMDKI